jgi:predicted nucleotidyltransferase
MHSIAPYKETFRRRQEEDFAERERLREATLAAIVPGLQRIGQRHAASVGRLFIFGSLTCPGRFTAYSDIDVAVEWDQKGDYFGLWRELEVELGREVDFRELGDDQFSERVRQHGMVVYES